MEVDMTINADILETLPWIDYSEVFEKIEARGRTEGKTEGRTEGKAERDMEIALNAFTKWKKLDAPAIAENLKSLGISEAVVEAARKQAGAERAHGRGARSEPEM
jgi:predicted transposase YdaD